jgi:hypothetical protein
MAGQKCRTQAAGSDGAQRGDGSHTGALQSALERRGSEVRGKPQKTLCKAAYRRLNMDDFGGILWIFWRLKAKIPKLVQPARKWPIWQTSNLDFSYAKTALVALNLGHGEAMYSDEVPTSSPVLNLENKHADAERLSSPRG